MPRTLGTGIDQCALLIVDNRSNVIKNLPVQISTQFDDLSASLNYPVAVGFFEWTIAPLSKSIPVPLT